MNTLKPERQVAVIRSLVEGNSIRATVRMTGVAKNTIVKLLVELGQVCSAFQDAALRNLNCKYVQCDEIWAFVGAKEKNATDEKKAELGYGDVWTWTAIDADTKLAVSWFVGDRSAESALELIQDLKGRLAHQIQLTTDGHRAYVSAVEETFGINIDYAQLVKLYGEASDGEKRYSPAECTGTKKVRMIGHPVSKYVSTKLVERQNLTMRMSMRRFTRLTNAFSKKVENHVAAISLHFLYYNFCRAHQTLTKNHPSRYPTTPAMGAGVADHVWTIEELVNLLNSN
jgi:IS1 family transposase